jgi:hypothetical protein
LRPAGITILYRAIAKRSLFPFLLCKALLRAVFFGNSVSLVWRKAVQGYIHNFRDWSRHLVKN